MSAPLLSVPRYNSRLAEIEKRPKKIRNWLNLLATDCDDSARQILTVLYAHNRISMPLHQRLRNLDAFDQTLGRIAPVLFQTHRDMSIPMSASTRNSISLLQKMHTELAYGYKLILLELSGEGGGKTRQIRLIAAVRAMKSLVNNLFYRYHSYADASPGLWRDIYSIYRITGLAATETAACTNLLALLRQEFQTALLLHLTLPAGLHPLQLADTLELLRRWPVNHPKLAWLDAASATGRQDIFMLALKSSSGPTRIWSDFTATASDAMRFFDARPALTALRQLQRSLRKGQRAPLLQTLDGDDSHIAALLTSLSTCWGKPAARQYARREVSGSIFVCNGVSCLHSMLSRHSSAASASAGLDYPGLSRWQILNVSEGGAGIAHNKALPHGFQPGDLIGLMWPDSSGWQLGTVRWIRNNKRYQMGIQSLGDDVMPATLSGHHSSSAHTLFPALLASGKAGTRRPHSIFIDHPGAHQLNDPLYLHCQDQTTRLRKPVVRSTLSYKQIVPSEPSVCFRGA